MDTSGLGLALRLLGMGWYIALCIISGAGIGVWLDKRLDVLPLFTLLGVLLGSGLAFYGVYKLVLPLLAGDEKRTKQ